MGIGTVSFEDGPEFMDSRGLVETWKEHAVRVQTHPRAWLLTRAEFTLGMMVHHVDRCDFPSGIMHQAHVRAAWLYMHALACIRLARVELGEEEDFN